MSPRLAVIILLLVLFQPLACKLSMPMAMPAAEQASIALDETLDEESRRVRTCCGIRWSRTAQTECPAPADADWLAVAPDQQITVLHSSLEWPARHLDPPAVPVPPAGITILLI